MISKDAEKAIAQHFKAPPNVKRMAERATFDLYHVPLGTEQDYEDDEPYPGFSEACDIVRAWCDDALSDVWYDSQSGQVLDSEPRGYSEECWMCGGTGNDPSRADEDADAEDGDCPQCGGECETWVEPEWQDFHHFEVKDAKRMLFDKELVTYI